MLSGFVLQVGDATQAYGREKNVAGRGRYAEEAHQLEFEPNADLSC